MVACMRTFALCLCLSIAAPAIARADQDLVIVPKLTLKVQALRRARAEIITGAIFISLAIWASAVAAWSFLGLRSCSGFDECDSIDKLVGGAATAAWVLEGSVGLAVFISGQLREADADKKPVRVRPIGGPGAFGGGLRVEF